MRLHVDVFSFEQFLGSLYGQFLGYIGKLATTVVSAARVAFGVFVSPNRSDHVQHGLRDVVFTGDQFDVDLFPPDLAH